MISVIIYVDSSNQYKGFDVKGHAGYAENGFDIICSAVSVLTVNTINSIEKFTKDFLSCKSEDGYISFRLKDILSSESKLLIDSMILGLNDIMESYGKKYMKISYKEV